MLVRGTTDILATLLIGAFLILVWTAAARKSETIDEGLFIANGVAQIELRDPNFDLSHPPLPRVIAGLSAAHLGGAKQLPQPVPRVPRGAVDLYDYKVMDAFQWAVSFFYDAGNDHDRVLFWGRFPFALFGALAGVLIFFEARRTLGDMAALAGLAAFLFTPEVLAHAEWAHSDLASACLLVALALTLARTLEQPSRLNDLLLGCVFGVTIGVKFTALLLLPPVLALVAFWPGSPEGSSRLRWALLRCGCVVAPLYLVIVAMYLPVPRLWPHEFLPTDLARFVGGVSESGSVTILAGFLRWLPLPDSFLKGLIYTGLLEKHGQLAYLHGAISATGWWYYFPVAVVLKYPTPLLLVAAAGFAAIWRMTQLSWARRIAWTLPPLILFVSAMTQNINIGVRSVLFLAPFLGLWTAVAAAAARTKVLKSATVGLVALSMLSGIAAWPNFLTWFNPLFGGTQAADRWLIDSNLDWGQDLPELARVLHQRGISTVRLAFFGWGRPEHWQIRALDPTVRAPGWYAVSRSYFSGIWGPMYAWLRDIPPAHLVGGSIALVEVTPELLKAHSPQTTAEQEESLMKLGLAARYEQQQPLAAAKIFAQVLALNPRHYGALFQRAAALDAAGQSAEALAAWKAFEPRAEEIGDFTNLTIARERIRWLEGKGAR
jgi:hypothetical protein